MRELSKKKPNKWISVVSGEDFGHLVQEKCDSAEHLPANLDQKLSIAKEDKRAERDPARPLGKKSSPRKSNIYEPG